MLINDRYTKKNRNLTYIISELEEITKKYLLLIKEEWGLMNQAQLCPSLSVLPYNNNIISINNKSLA